MSRRHLSFSTPLFGRTEERHFNSDGSTDLIERRYKHGRPVLAIRSKEETIFVEDKEHAYSVIAQGLNIVATGEASRIMFEVQTDPETGNFKWVIQRYEVGREAK